MRLLVVTAVPAERDAVRAGAPADLDVVAVGVGPAAAAAGTAAVLARAEATGDPFDAVVCAGVAGGFPGRAAVGDVVVATRSVAAGLGAESPDGFMSLEELGFGASALPAVPDLLTCPDAVRGAVLTVTTATGTAATAEALAARYPDAVAEAMEGFGVATAAARARLPFAEVRTIANLVGPRDRGSWRLAEAFAALGAVFRR